jgi:hypothetical protein
VAVYGEEEEEEEEEVEEEVPPSAATDGEIEVVQPSTATAAPEGAGEIEVVLPSSATAAAAPAPAAAAEARDVDGVAGGSGSPRRHRWLRRVCVRERTGTQPEGSTHLVSSHLI